MFADNSTRYQSIPSTEVELHDVVDNNVNQMKNNLSKFNKWMYLLVAFTLSIVVVVMFTFHSWSPFTSVVTQDSINVPPKNNDVLFSKMKSSTESEDLDLTVLQMYNNPILTGPYCMKTNGGGVTKQFNCNILKTIKAKFDAKLPIYDENNTALSDTYGQSIRLAFHDAGEIDLSNPSDKLGPDGCLSSDPESNGITERTSVVYTFIEPFWQEYCEYLTRADFWALIGKLAVESAAKPTSNFPEGDNIIIPYKYGRTDNKKCHITTSRLPDAQQGYHGPNGLDAVFIQRMGLTLDDVVTLSGAHTVGKVHIVNSGFGISTNSISNNAWDNSPSHFDNNYFEDMIGKITDTNVWSAQLPVAMTTKDPLTLKNVWVIDEPEKAANVMLNSDMALAFTFSQESNFQASNIKQNNPNSYQSCTKRPQSPPGCMNPISSVIPPSYPLVAEYAKDNKKFLKAFAKAYDKMTSVGYSTDPSHPGKLGTLKYLTSCDA